MDRLDEVWPEDDTEAFSGVFDDALSTSRYGHTVVLAAGKNVSEADREAWIASHRPPPPWNGTLIVIRADNTRRLGYTTWGVGTPRMRHADLPPCSCALCTGTGPARDSG